MAARRNQPCHCQPGRAPALSWEGKLRDTGFLTNSRNLSLTLKNWTYKCKEGMKFEDDVNRDTFEVECIEGDNSSDAVADKWPRCKPGKRNVSCSCHLNLPATF